MTYPCTAADCEWPATTRVVVAHHPAAPAGFAIIRPLVASSPAGDPYCVDCAHSAVDGMLAAARPVLAWDQRPEQM